MIPRTGRWANWLALGATLAALFAGLLVRDGVLSEAVYYEDPSAGIAALRPAEWLVDREGDYVFRLRDPAGRPFKTTLQVAVMTIGPDAAGRNVLDALTLQRSARLSGYRVLSIHDEGITTGGAVAEMRYAYVESEPAPFLETLPVVVVGVDVVFFKSNQAIIASYIARADEFDRYYFHFERFLRSLRF